eukprot:1776422-Prymnesium_polylepis.1
MSTPPNTAAFQLREDHRSVKVAGIQDAVGIPELVARRLWVCGNADAAGPYRWKPENRPGKGQGEWRRDKGAIQTAIHNARAAAAGTTVT